jgi:hypothetical protein
MKTNALRSRKSVKNSRHRFGPEVLGLERRMMLASGSAVAAVTATGSQVATVVGDVPPLSVKRVPGFLSGYKVDDMATPYDAVNNPGRVIDDKTVDYWKITLNEDDTVELTVTPNSNAGSTGFIFRIWNEDNTEILPANKQPISGTQFTFRAKVAGTYTIGISTAGNSAYPFTPTKMQSAPSGPSTVAFSALFNVYPGPKTNLVNILTTYKSDWPKWTKDQQTAYDTLRTIATNSNNVTGTGIINFGGSFEEVKDATAAEIAGWVTNTWNPFLAILGSTTKLQTAINNYNDNAYPAINAAYTKDQWVAVATQFINNQTLQQAYESVHARLLDASEARTNIVGLIQDLKSWSIAYQTVVGTRPLAIAQLLTTGLTQVPKMTEKVQQYGWLKTLLGSITNIAAGIAGIFGGPPAALATSILGNSILNPVDAYLDGDFDNGTKPVDPSKTDTSSVMLDAAAQMQNFSNDTFAATFNLLASPAFVSSLFSNYGLLKAMQYVLFDPNSLGGATPQQNGSGDPILTPNETGLRASYDTTVWKQLLPKMFKWKELSYTQGGDNAPENSLRNFTFFVPQSEKVTWDTDINFLPGSQNNDYSHSASAEFSETKEQTTAEALTELEQLQLGQPFNYLGHDFTPAGEYIGPGPISAAQTLTGNASSLYTITTDSELQQDPLYKGEGGIAGYWKSWSTVKGLTIHEWALVTSNDERMSAAAADQLFGTGALSAVSNDPVYYPDKGKTSYTYDFNVQSGGLATRLDVFSNWGQGVAGFSPHSFQPTKLNETDGRYMSVQDPVTGRWSRYFPNIYAWYKLSYPT